MWTPSFMAYASYLSSEGDRLPAANACPRLGRSRSSIGGGGSRRLPPGHSLCDCADHMPIAARGRRIEDLRRAIDCLPVRTREAMLAGVRDGQPIIVGAYIDGEGGVCPMLAAHRRGGRTDLPRVRARVGPVHRTPGTVPAARASASSACSSRIWRRACSRTPRRSWRARSPSTARCSSAAPCGRRRSARRDSVRVAYARGPILARDSSGSRRPAARGSVASGS